VALNPGPLAEDPRHGKNSTLILLEKRQRSKMISSNHLKTWHSKLKNVIPLQKYVRA